MARTKLVMALALTIALVGAGSAAWADAPPGPYFNGFEDEYLGVVQLQRRDHHSRAVGISASIYATGVSPREAAVREARP